MSQLSLSPRYQSDIKFRWCPTVDCRGVNNVLLVLTSVTGTQIDLLWRDDLGWYESELSRLPYGLHTAIIVFNIKVYDENWKCISREKQFKVDTFHIVSHKFAIELFLDSNEELFFWSDTPTLRHRYISYDNLEYTKKDLKSDTNDSEKFNYMYHSTPDLKCIPNNNKHDKDFDHTLNAVKFLSNRVRSLGLSTPLKNDSNVETHEQSRKSPLFNKCNRSSFLHNKENQNSIDLQITEIDTIDITKKKEIILEQSVFEYANYSEISASEESDIWHVAEKRKENEYAANKSKNIIKHMNEEDQNSSCKLEKHDISMKYNEQSTIFTTFTSEKNFSEENLSHFKNDPTITLKKLKNKSINKTIDLDDDTNFQYDSLKGEDIDFHIDIKNINESDTDDDFCESYRETVKSYEKLFSFTNSVEKLNVDEENYITYLKFKNTSDFNDGIKACNDNFKDNSDENLDEMKSDEAINTAYFCDISKEYVNKSIENNSLEVDHLPANNKRSDQTKELTEVISNLENQENIMLEVDESSFQHYKASLGRSSESVKSNINNHENYVTDTNIKKEISLSRSKKQTESPKISYVKKSGDLIDNDFYSNGVKDIFEYSRKSLYKDSPLYDDTRMDLKRFREANNSVKLKNTLLPSKLNVAYSRQPNRSKFLTPTKDYRVQQNLSSLQRNLYSICSPKTKEVDNSFLNTPSLYYSNKITFDKDQHIFENDSIKRNKNLHIDDKSRYVWNDNLIPYKTRNKIYKSTVDKTDPPTKFGSRDLYTNHRISQKSFQPSNELHQKNSHGARSRLSNFTNCDKYGGSLNNLHEYPLQQTFSSRFMNDSFSDPKRKLRVSSNPNLQNKENLPYKSIRNSENRNRFGSQSNNLYTDYEYTRYGTNKPLGDLDGSGDSTESLLDEAERILNFTLQG